MTSVGQKLKDARIAKGLTLDDLQQTTKIQKRYLIAIEEGNYDALPGKFYVKAFARQYAETVGLNPNEIIQELDQELGMPASPEEQPETTSRVQKREELTRPQDNSLSAKISKYLPTIIIVVVVVAILGTIYAVAWGNHEKAKNQQIEQTNTKVAVSTDVKKPAKKKKSESSTTSKKEQKIVNVASAGSTFTYNVENAPSQSTIELGASGGSSWDAVYVGGAQSWQGTLQSGATREIQVPAGTSRVVLSIGNSNASTVKINGHKLNFLAQNSSLTVRKLVLNFTNGSSTTNAETQSQSQTQTAAQTQGQTVNNQNGYQTNQQQRYQQNNGRTNNYQTVTR
ncbi:MAG TPA: DUF4115 domain-containing protein [Candidatus Ligilactobacillus faecavium]|nr:DUF4115 domain-containing protein [Candidatus Ligilactobacillus faecavium]